MTRIVISFLSAFALTTAAHAQSGCSSDISGDGQVNGVDLAMVLSDWGPCTSGAAISGVFPQSGSTAGGTPIAIVGVDLGATASVTIGGIAVQSFTVVSPTVVTVVTPAGGVGAKTLALRNAQGQQIAAASFAYFTTSLPWGTVLEQLPDPTVVTDAALRTAIVATGLPWRMRDNGTGIEMLLVPPGTFAMGAGPDVLDAHWQELPQHQVTLTSAYYMSRTEVTQGQWVARTGSNPASFQPPMLPTADLSLPIETISWDAIQTFLTGTGLRLPTEAEWEFAYRGGTTTEYHGAAPFPSGTSDESLVPQIAWVDLNALGRTRPVGTKLANGFGLRDMGGNVWEFCQDRFAGYTAEPQTDPTGAEQGGPVVRGGAYNDQGYRSRASMRLPLLTDSAASHVGFRVARNP
jgi:formylglycine-generating enzyme required for sulfatase activity